MISLSLLNHLADIAKKGRCEGEDYAGPATRGDLKIDNLNSLIIDRSKQVLRSVEEQSFVETLSQLEQMKPLFLVFTLLTFGRKI